MSGIFHCIDSRQYDFHGVLHTGVQPHLEVDIHKRASLTEMRWLCWEKALSGEEKCFRERVSYRCVHFLMTDCMVHTTAGTSNTACSISVVLANDYLTFAAQQDNSIAMGAKWRWTGNMCWLISAIKASCLHLLTQDPGVWVCENVCNINVAVEREKLHHHHLTVLYRRLARLSVPRGRI